MAIQERNYTLEQFDEFVELPENTEKLFEFIGGEIFQVPSNPFSSKISQIISGELYIYLKQNDIGHLTGEQGGYIVAGERYAPDVAFISYEKQPELAKSGYNPNPPDLAVEVISSDSAIENEKLTIKLGNYLASGTLVWIVRPEKKYIEIHQSGKPTKVFGEDATLDGGEVLPRLQIKVSDILK
jgi:Uma2 family endonuclease